MPECRPTPEARITDFNVSEDQILLDLRIFTELGDEGALTFGSFHKSSAGTAQDANDRIIYDTDSGALSYDADGSGQGAAIQFATLAKNLALSADDFYII